jgi:hypothetical protein
MNDEKLRHMDLPTLRRKRDQAWECAGLARKDNDPADEERWILEATKYMAEIGRRVRAQEGQE